MACTLCVVPSDPLHEDASCYVMLHDDSAVAGHAMVVAKRHVENVADLPEEEWLAMAAVWRRVERALLDVTGRERSIVMKLGIAAPHLHIHLYPVAASASRAEVQAAIDAKVREERPADFEARLREALA